MLFDHSVVCMVHRVVLAVGDLQKLHMAHGNKPGKSSLALIKYGSFGTSYSMKTESQGHSPLCKTIRGWLWKYEKQINPGLKA